MFPNNFIVVTPHAEEKPLTVRRPGQCFDESVDVEDQLTTHTFAVHQIHPTTPKHVRAVLDFGDNDRGPGNVAAIQTMAPLGSPIDKSGTIG